MSHQLEIAAQGITRFGIDVDSISCVRLPVPPIQDQRRIAAFLDHHAARIDALIAKKRRLLGLLGEKRQALISRSVTKGLNERSPMKESGVPWVGLIPTHWSLSRLKHVSRAIIDTEHKSALPTIDGEYPIIRTSDVKKGELLLDNAQRTDRATYLEWTKRAVPEPGDLVFTREAPAGEVGIIPPGAKLLIGQRTVLIKIDVRAATPDYVLLAMQSPHVSEFIQDASRGSTVPHFNMEDVHNIPLLVPPKPEQVSLVEQVTAGAKRVGAVQERIQAGIGLLEEKRSALITAAVTGQLDISNWTPPAQSASA